MYLNLCVNPRLPKSIYANKLSPSKKQYQQERPGLCVYMYVYMNMYACMYVCVCMTVCV